MAPDQGAHLLNALLFKHWTVEDEFDVTPSSYTFRARCDLEPENCPKCGSLRKPYRHGTVVGRYRDAPMHGKHVMIVVAAARYQCQDCKATFTQHLPEMHPDRDMTRRCFDFVQDAGLRRPYTTVAAEVGFKSDKSVSEICKPYLNWLLEGHHVYAPVVMGLDETKLDGVLRTVVTDIGERRVIEVLPDDTGATLAKWLVRLPHREHIAVVTMDMKAAYRKVVTEVLPTSFIVADKFHVLRMANKRLDEFRASVKTAHEITRKEARLAGKRVPKKLKYKWSDRRVLHMSPEAREKLKPMKRMMFEATLANDPALAAVWSTKERFYEIWNANDREEAWKRFEEWKSTIPPEAAPHYVPVAKTIDNWQTEVFNYFDNQYTNAYAEAANRLIKVINRRGHGYRFQGIRARAIHMTKDRPDDHFVCEDCLGRFPVDQRREVPTRFDNLRPFQVCAGCQPTLYGFVGLRTLIHGRLSTPKSG
ncbi:ISL3 family transposase [Methylobacterium sp. Gmos1]